MSNIHTFHHNKDSSGRSLEIESYIEESINFIISNCRYDFFRNIKNKNCLSLGCDYGYDLNYLNKKYNLPKDNLFGCDPFYEINPFDLNLNKLDMGSSSFVEDLYKITNKKSFDIIILNHSLEHVHNPYLVLNNINKIRNENTILFIAVPKVGHEWAYWEEGHYSIWDERWLIKFIKDNKWKSLLDLKTVCLRKPCKNYYEWSYNDKVEIWGLFK